jgi:hypothetical protein
MALIHLASSFILIYTIVAPSCGAQIFETDETIPQLSLRALLSPQEQWRLARMVDEREPGDSGEHSIFRSADIVASCATTLSQFEDQPTGSAIYYKP